MKADTVDAVIVRIKFVRRAREIVTGGSDFAILLLLPCDAIPIQVSDRHWELFPAAVFQAIQTLTDLSPLAIRLTYFGQTIIPEKYIMSAVSTCCRR